MQAAHTQNISYYNEIANSYDAILDKELSNEAIRRRVGDRFREVVPTGTVLDFGGGTGRDLEWLMVHGYQVIFCEPSAGMREQAIRQWPQPSFPQSGQEGKPPQGIVRFLSGDETDFTRWQKDLPVLVPVDGILANFAVINCIPDIGLLFNNLAGVLKPGGHLIALILRPKWTQVLRTLVSRQPVTLRVRYKEHEQTVFIHTRKSINEAAAPYFNFSRYGSLRGSVFSLIELTRK
jgi:SAM-dependent methyltransferase